MYIVARVENQFIHVNNVIKKHTGTGNFVKVLACARLKVLKYLYIL